MKYGQVYSKISKKLMEKISGFKFNTLVFLFARIYFRLFGYPDIASQMRFQLVAQYLSLKEGISLLDVGSGNGIYAMEYAHAHNLHVVGFEGRKVRVNNANAISKELKIPSRFILKNLETVSWKKNSFDIIICLEVLEHIKKDKRLLKEMVYSLKSEGKLIMTVPYCNKEGQIEHTTYQHFEHVRNGYTFDYFLQVARDLGLDIKELKPYFLFFTKFTVKLQQYIFQHLSTVINILSYPLLLFIARFDSILPIRSTARGIFVVFEKKN